jgi:hypothetical protein
MTINIKPRLVGSITRIAICAAVALTVLAMAATAASASSRLPAYGVLHAGESLTSPNGRFILAMQPDGNLVEYQGPCCSVVLWHTHTDHHPGARLEMQGVGNAVVYSPSNSPLWYSGTSGQAGSHLDLQDDANLVIYSPTGPYVWANYAKPQPTPPPQPPPPPPPFKCFTAHNVPWETGTYWEQLSGDVCYNGIEVRAKNCNPVLNRKISLINANVTGCGARGSRFSKIEIWATEHISTPGSLETLLFPAHEEDREPTISVDAWGAVHECTHVHQIDRPVNISPLPPTYDLNCH